MQLRKMVTVLAAASVAMAFIAGCGNKSVSNQPGETMSLYPRQIMQGLKDPRLEGKIFAVGLAQASNLTNARSRADIEADRRIAATFQQRIAAIVKDFNSETNGQAEDHYQAAAITRVNELMSGIVELSDYATRELLPDGKTTRVYVIRYIAAQELLAIMNDMITQMQNNNPSRNLATQLRASKAFREIEDMINEGKPLEAM